ncbi:MAG: DUF2953 domain-containing protein [Clostridia bacterium]|nr:DUF2953 domain-containing protein [Clostridia bacterium]
MAGVFLWILYAFLIIIGVLLFAFVLLSFAKYQVYFYKDPEKYEIKIKAGFFTVYKLPSKKKKSTDEENQKKSKKVFFDKDEKDIKIRIGDSDLSILEIGRNMGEISSELKEIFETSMEMIKYFGKSLSFKYLNIQIIVSDDDPADTGRNYGLLCSVFYPVMEFISHKVKIKKHSYDLGYNFSEVRPYYKIEGQARLRGFHLLRLLIKSFGIFPKVDNIKNINKKAV